jgi:hypothetical protein
MVSACKMTTTGEEGSVFIARIPVNPDRGKLASRQLFLRLAESHINEESYHQYY